MDWLFAYILVTTVVAGIVLIVWRRELTQVQVWFFGAQMHPGCAIIEGVLLMLLGIAMYLAFRGGVFDANPSGR